jgi:histidyl-tRNA synthetase
LGGKETPSVGFAFGVERLLLILEELKLLPAQKPENDIYVVVAGEEAKNYGFKIAHLLRNKMYRVGIDLNNRSMKAQMRAANKVEATYAIVIGEDELKSETVTIKNMKDSTQQTIPFSELNSFHFNLA